MGKSLYVQHLMEKLTIKNVAAQQDLHVIIPLHGPVVTTDSLLEVLEKSSDVNTSPAIIHFDVSQSVSYNANHSSRSFKCKINNPVGSERYRLFIV